MADLFLGLAIMTGASIVTFAVTLWASRNCSRIVGDGLALLIVAGIFAYIHYLWYQTRLVAVLPFSSLIILGNWFPIAAAALAGLAWFHIPGCVWRRSFSISGLVAVAAYTMVSPLLGRPPQCDNQWTSDRICLQTTLQTCTPACAATLLDRYGIRTTEQEMAELCLTRAGTNWQGLYRGLKRKLAGSPWDVEVMQCDANQVASMSGEPLIMSVGLSGESATDLQEITAEWGWKPGIGHSVVLLKKNNLGRYLVADPTPGIGREEWSDRDLQTFFRGTAMRIVKRGEAFAPH